jgi:hypothetical protein
MAIAAAAIPAVIDHAKDVMSRWIGDPAERDKAAAELAMQLQQADLISLQGQIDIDKAEAQSGSLWQGGWRPGIGWICGAGLAWQYLVNPLIATVNAITHSQPVPSFDASGLMPLLFGMLGLGALRTVERTQGVAAGQGPASREAAITTKLKTSTTLVQR